MTTPDTEKTMAEVLADHGRPVSPEGLAAAKATLTAARRRRNPAARAALLARLRAA